MIHLIAAVFLIPCIAFADVSVPRSKQYLWTVYDVATSGGESVTKNLGVSLPGGAIVTDTWVYINTPFAASGNESLALQCGGTRNLMAYNGMKLIPVNSALQAHLGLSLLGSGAMITEGASVQSVLNLGNVASVPADCAMQAVIRGDAGFTPYTAGKATVIIEYFRQ